jgi:hypothetical protein
VTKHVVPGTKQTLELTLPDHSDKWEVTKGALLAGDDIVTVTSTVAAAEKLCKSTVGCAGFTFKNGGVACTAAARCTGLEAEWCARGLVLGSNHGLPCHHRLMASHIVLEDCPGDWCLIPHLHVLIFEASIQACDQT